MDFAKKLSALMRSRGRISANKLARMSGVSQTQISRVLRGESTFTIVTLGAVCDALGITVEEFMKPEYGSRYESISASADEIEFLLNYRKLGAAERTALETVARALLKTESEKTDVDRLYDKLDAARTGQDKSAWKAKE